MNTSSLLNVGCCSDLSAFLIELESVQTYKNELDT